MPISDAESVVMDVLWRSRAPMSAEEVVAALSVSSDWQEATIKTLLNRLLTKRAITAARDGKRYLYSARLKREDYVHSESKGLIDRLAVRSSAGRARFREGSCTAPGVPHPAQPRMPANATRKIRKRSRMEYYRVTKALKLFCDSCLVMSACSGHTNFRESYRHYSRPTGLHSLAA